MSRSLQCGWNKLPLSSLRPHTELPAHLAENVRRPMAFELPIGFSTLFFFFSFIPREAVRSQGNSDLLSPGWREVGSEKRGAADHRPVKTLYLFF